MNQLKFLYNHKDPVTRYIFRYGILMPVLFFIFWAYPLSKEINTKGKFNCSIHAADGSPLAYVPFVDGRRNDVPLLTLDSNALSIFNYLIQREDPRLLNQNSIWGKFWLNYRGVSARNFNLFSNGGGSTLCQQFLKWRANSRMLTDNTKRTIISKMGEMSASYKLSWHYSPEEILQLYVNEVGWLNAGSKGVQLNAVNYFDVQSINDLSAYEQYILARSVKGVTAAGIDYRKLNKIGRDSLDLLFANSFRSMLVDNGRATEDELKQMLYQPVRFRKSPLNIGNQSYLFDLIKPLNDSFELEGFQYLTTLEKPAINAIDAAFERYAKQNASSLYVGNVLLDVNAVVLDLQTGNIIGINSQPLCSPKDTTQRMQCHVFAAKPIASPIKVMLIAEGFKSGVLNENSVLLDEYRGRLHNYDNRYNGNVSLSTVIQKSLNTPLDNFIGRNALVDNLEQDLNTVFGNVLTALPKNTSKSQYCLGEPRLLSVPQVAMLFRGLLTDGIVYNTRITQTIISTDKYPFDTVRKWQPQAYKIFPQATCRSIRELLKAPLTSGGTLHKAATLLNNPAGVVGKSGTSADYNNGWTILANNKYLVVVNISYFNPENSKVESRIAIPTKSGGGSAGVIAAFILNNLN
jgi:membrane peptidoglycan carboxypeptidase